MQSLRRACLFFLLLLRPLIGQTADSLNVFCFSDTLNPQFKSAIDSSLDGFQKYYFRNNLGNNGLAEYELFLPRTHYSPGFNFHENYFEKYFYLKKDIKYYSTINPFTELNLVVGAKKEQSFNVLHTQNINKNLNLTFFFKRLRSEGWYQRQNVNHNNLYLTTNYRTTNNKYLLLFAGWYNSIDAAQNGGIKADSLFENGNFTDKKLIPINLPSANRKITSKAISLKQYFYLKAQSTDSLSKKVKYSSISHSVNIEDYYWLYESASADTSFYQDVFVSTSYAFDRVKHYSIENELAWQLLDYKKNTSFRKVATRLFAKHQFVDFNSSAADSVINNFIVGMNIYSLRKVKHFFFSLSTDYVVNGFNAGDYRASWESKFFLRDSTQYLYFNAYTENRIPDFFYLNYKSNHFIWKNEFEKTLNTYESVAYVNNKYKLSLGAQFFQYGNFIYLDNYALPRQLDFDLHSISYFFQKEFKVKNFILKNTITYQSTPDSTILRFPDLVTTHSFFYENYLFKKALFVQAGVDVFYNSAFYSNAFMPATAEYYLQNDKNIGNYPYVDVFINMRIKTVRVFVKMEHINSGLSGNYYYLVPSYPSPDRAFKVGINWKFYN